jgi:hypothetical protein
MHVSLLGRLNTWLNEVGVSKSVMQSYHLNTAETQGSERMN